MFFSALAFCHVISTIVSEAGSSIPTFLLYYKLTDQSMIKNEEGYVPKKPGDSAPGDNAKRAQEGNRRNRFYMKRENFKGACEALSN